MLYCTSTMRGPSRFQAAIAMATSTAGNAAAARLTATTGAWTAITRPKAGLFTSHGASVIVACTLLA